MDGKNSGWAHVFIYIKLHMYVCIHMYRYVYACTHARESGKKLTASPVLLFARHHIEHAFGPQTGCVHTDNNLFELARSITTWN